MVLCKVILGRDSLQEQMWYNT